MFRKSKNLKILFHDQYKLILIDAHLPIPDFLHKLKNRTMYRIIAVGGDCPGVDSSLDKPINIQILKSEISSIN